MRPLGSAAGDFERDHDMSDNSERAVLAGGCFWGMQDLIRRQRGVLSTRVGYTGGEVKNATYRNHGNHAEAIEIMFDPRVTSFRDILEFFFQIHDPSTRNRQGNDIGASYRSAIFYTSDEQKRIAQDTIADIDASGLWPGKATTEVVPGGRFLGSRARAPGLSRKNPQRLHLPLRASRLETAAPQGGMRFGSFSPPHHARCARREGSFGPHPKQDRRPVARVHARQQAPLSRKMKPLR